jgi:cytosine permease
MPHATSELEELDNALGHEYEHEPVPLSARRSTFSVSMVWIGFPMIITGAITGSILVAGMGFKPALWAMIIGNILMFAYVGASGALGTRRGQNYAMVASAVFGKKGYIFSSGLLSTLLLGWYAVQTGITGNLIHVAFNVNYLAMTVLAGVLYLAITFVGIKGLHWIGVVSVPLFVILGGWVAIDSATTAGWDQVMSYAGTKPAMSMSFGVALTIVITLFVDAATVTADFNRWAIDTKSSLIATFWAFPFANLLAMLVGGVMTAAVALPNPQPFGLDNMFGYMIGQHKAWLSVIAFVFLFCNLGSVCAHCLYNSATGWSRIGRGRMRVFAVGLAIIGIVIAAANVWALFIPWLGVLGILVPPIGAIVIADLYFVRPNATVDADWRATPFMAWVVGSAVGYVVETYASQFSTAICSFVAGALCYFLLSAVSGQKTKSPIGVSMK